jgi:hypothetical protein
MLRIALTFTAALLALSAVPVASSAQDPFPGTWHGVAAVNGMSCTFDRVMTTTGTYSEIERCGTLATGQSGTFHVFPNHTISFVVTDWTPKQRYVMDSGYSGHYEPNAKPPGGTFAYTFTTPNALVFRDVNFGGSLTYRRLR